jgi:vacuolar-type H+-ATPase subunit E/Vma4
VNGDVWTLSFQRITGHLDMLASHFDNFFGDILDAAADVTNAMAVIFDPTASTLDKVMAGLDLAIDLGKKFVGLFKDEAHEATNDLRDNFLSQFGTGNFVGFNNLAAQLAKIEGGTPAFKALLDAKTPEAFAVAMERVNRLLANTPQALAAASGFQTKAQLQEMAAEAVKIHAYMRDSGLFTAATVQEAWERANAALVKAGDESAMATEKTTAALNALKSELKGLEDSVASEAWEEEMGDIEKAQRERIANIKEELQAREAQIEEEKKAREAANEDAADHLQQILAEQVFVAKLKFDYELPEGLTVTGGSGVPGFASGTKGQYLDFGAGTLAMLHGKERVVTEAEGRAGAVGGDDGYAPIHVQVGEETLIKAIVKVRKRLRLHV